MTYIQDIENDSHIHEDIRLIALQRREETWNAFTELVKYMGIVLSGGTIAIFSFIASRRGGPIPLLAVVSLLSFIIAILSFSFLLYRNYLLCNDRWAYYVDVLNKFLSSEASLEDVLRVQQALHSKWLYNFLFWLPFSFMGLGFLCGTGAAFTLIGDGVR